MRGMTTENEETSGIDAIIRIVESYIEDPKLVTPETLSALKDDLVDLKSYLDGDGEEEPEKGSGGLTIVMEKARGGTR